MIKKALHNLELHHSDIWGGDVKEISNVLGYIFSINTKIRIWRDIEFVDFEMQLRHGNKSPIVYNSIFVRKN